MESKSNCIVSKPVKNQQVDLPGFLPPLLIHNHLTLIDTGLIWMQFNFNMPLLRFKTYCSLKDYSRGSTHYIVRRYGWSAKKITA